MFLLENFIIIVLEGVNNVLEDAGISHNVTVFDKIINHYTTNFLVNTILNAITHPYMKHL